ncbi:MAG: PQQ-binding-like beta-propeller repeat protein, partial [Blastocatellia bacterium]|nr:PQQ-binding-like beta-propeller repeat protein [Blastocatellia bacterium]
MSTNIAKIFLITAGLAALSAGPTNRPIAGRTDWPSYGHDPEATQFSPLRQITPQNVAKLKVAWTFDLRPEAPDPPATTATTATTATVVTAATAKNDAHRPPRARISQTSPLVVGNVMYLGTPYGRVHAFNATTGAVIWETDIGTPSGRRGLAYWPGNEKYSPRILIGTGNGFLIALDAKAGKPVESFGEKGRVNLRIGVADKFPQGRYGMSSPPTVYKELIFTGASLQERPSTGPSGAIRAWDAITGKLVWTFHTIPEPGEANHETWTGDEWVDRSGANSWGFMSVDPARGILYVPVGTPTTDFYGGDRHGANLYGSSLLALDARSGSLRWYFQTTHHDNWDYDLCAAPVLLTIKHGKREIPAVAQWTKQGLLFFFNRITGEPIYGVE